MIKTIAYFAVRRNESHERIDIETASGSFIYTALLTQKLDHEIPTWADANPVVRIAQFRIEEVKI